MIKIQDKTNCSGCHACAQICPKQCITMRPDEEGFLYPVVDADLCIECGLCEKSCPIYHPLTNEKTEKDITAYAAINRDDEIRAESSSGGVFSLIAFHVIERGGVVFGAAFDEHFQVEHQYTETKEGIAAFRGSKYVQSRIGDSYRKAEVFLKAGRLVLFTGTPCQIGGLLAYLKKDYPNLITQDIICHGVVSPKIWDQYVRYREAKSGEKTRSVVFRHKQSGWKTYSVFFEFSNHTEYRKMHLEDPYMKAFLRNLSLRPSCYSCSFKSKIRKSDITLADFWGIQNVVSKMDDDKGCSLLFINSPKGQRVLDDVEKEIRDSLQVNIEQAMSYNTAMTESVSKPPNRDAFFKAADFSDWDALEKEFLRVPLLKKILIKGKSILKRILKG